MHTPLRSSAGVFFVNVLRPGCPLPPLPAYGQWRRRDSFRSPRRSPDCGVALLRVNSVRVGVEICLVAPLTRLGPILRLSRDCRSSGQPPESRERERRQPSRRVGAPVGLHRRTPFWKNECGMEPFRRGPVSFLGLVSLFCIVVPCTVLVMSPLLFPAVKGTYSKLDRNQASRLQGCVLCATPALSGKMPP